MKKLLLAMMILVLVAGSAFADRTRHGADGWVYIERLHKGSFLSEAQMKTAPNDVFFVKQDTEGDMEGCLVLACITGVTPGWYWGVTSDMTEEGGGFTAEVRFGKMKDWYRYDLYSQPGFGITVAQLDATVGSSLNESSLELRKVYRLQGDPPSYVYDLRGLSETIKMAGLRPPPYWPSPTW